MLTAAYEYWKWANYYLERDAALYLTFAALYTDAMLSAGVPLDELDVQRWVG